MRAVGKPFARRLGNRGVSRSERSRRRGSKGSQRSLAVGDSGLRGGRSREDHRVTNAPRIPDEPKAAAVRDEEAIVQGLVRPGVPFRS